MAATAPMECAAKGRVGRPGPSVVGRPAIVAIFAVLFAALGVGIYGLVDQPKAQFAAGIDTYLAKHQPLTDRTLVGTMQQPALTVEGDDVEVHAPGFSVLALVAGPVVPGEGLPFRPNFITSTWTITLSDVHGRVPLAVADWDSIDYRRVVFKPYLVPGEAKLPAFLTSGQHLRFELRAVMPVGEGLMRWAPNGHNIVAKWDYQVEND